MPTQMSVGGLGHGRQKLETGKIAQKSTQAKGRQWVNNEISSLKLLHIRFQTMSCRIGRVRYDLYEDASET